MQRLSNQEGWLHSSCFLLSHCASLCLTQLWVRTVVLGFIPGRHSQTYRKPHRHTNVKKKKKNLTGPDCDWYCLCCKRLCHTFVLSLHVSLHCCPWCLSPRENGCHPDTMTAVMTGRERQKILLLRLSWWMRKSHQPGKGRRDLLSCFCITSEKQTATLWLQLMHLWQQGEEMGKSSDVPNQKRCPSFNREALCLCEEDWCYWLFTTPS